MCLYEILQCRTHTRKNTYLGLHRSFAPLILAHNPTHLFDFIVKTHESEIATHYNHLLNMGIFLCMFIKCMYHKQEANNNNNQLNKLDQQ